MSTSHPRTLLLFYRQCKSCELSSESVRILCRGLLSRFKRFKLIEVPPRWGILTRTLEQKLYQMHAIINTAIRQKEVGRGASMDKLYLRDVM